MKKNLFLAIISLLFGINANAQVANQDLLNYSFGGVYSNSKGEKISKQDLQNYLSSYEYADYLNASRKFKNGVILTGVGVGCFATTALLVNGIMKEGDAYMNKYGDDYVPRDDDSFDEDSANFLGGAFYGGMLSWVFIGGGVVCTALGVPKIFIANGKMKRMATDHNNQFRASLSFGAQQYGYGIALRF